MLVDGHGNFGSIEGDGAAAMRYTEARLAKFTQEAYLQDLDKDVVNFVPNFDETEKEPEVLPVRIPNLLVNGAEGIAVGMATSIPTHNLGEVIDAVKAYMKNNEISTRQLMKYIKGPDFPTGGIVVNKDDLPDIYETGTGKIKIRGKVEVEDIKGRQEQTRDHRDPLHHDRRRHRKIPKRRVQSGGDQEDQRTSWTFPTSPPRRASALSLSSKRARTRKISSTCSTRRPGWRTPLA